MTSFDDRENAFERRFVHDQDLAFKAEARRNGLVARWAAGLMGRTGADLDAYAVELVEAGIGEGGRIAVLERIRRDFSAVHVSISDQQLEMKMQTTLAEAVRDLKTR